MTEDLRACLAPTRFLDCDAPELRGYAARATAGAGDARSRAVALFYAVRDGIRYDPYSVKKDPEAYVASRIAREPATFCVPKAILLAAAARAVGIPARLGFADVRNHLSSEKLRARMGTDLFIFHGYTELHLDGAWRKATPTFNRELCDRLGVPPLDFDGRSDALLHAFDREGRRHMEYVRDRGRFADLPLGEMLRVLGEVYGDVATQPRESDATFDGD